ncbi:MULTISPECIES: tyrosine-type recombinase/integrase [unclassified Bradyrhizobium]|uniref:tyrosine-type recombinase/integrase n=1 Tax=unclassified Bradyrhizobium TaxID=2631580 RepID=UPI001FF88FBB|nr:MULTISPECIES: tyrosine-type recombinase/integrase [unclassified Bradyrhizobium]MCK1709100.1 tyrosine-type recombinase/integrase [Bradyrhizobium sp. 143]MCK1732151.1 tyrosine-type recombinase/integrase [Bradyrhizobium sp. 142]
MARKISFSPLESRSARLRLKARRRPYSGPSLARGISLMYRRNKTNGTWVLKASNGHGAYWTNGFALADDFEDSNGKSVLTFYEAQDAAKKLARGENGGAGTAPITVDTALDDYKRDLEARAANPYNAEWPRLHLTPVLLAKPVQLLTATELKKWRDGLLGKIVPATINRLCRCLCAALEQASQHDERIQNKAWEVGLAGLPDAQEARNVIISDEEVREFIRLAYIHDEKFGLLSDVLAVTGARPSQAVRLLVEDLQDHPVRPKVMMPKSAKGGGRNRSQKKHERYSVPITPALSAKLKEAAKGRADDAPLLMQSDGRPWDKNPGQNYHRDVDKVVTAIGRAPAVVTMYALRHSSIVRMLLSNIPIRVVASLHNTSVAMIEKHYSRYIVEHSDDISRRALLQDELPTGENVVVLAS